MTENERFAWLQLAFTPYIGAESFLVLLQQFGSAQAVLSAPAEKIAALVRHKQAAESWRNADKRALAQQSAEAALLSDELLHTIEQVTEESHRAL